MVSKRKLIHKFDILPCCRGAIFWFMGAAFIASCSGQVAKRITKANTGPSSTSSVGSELPATTANPSSTSYSSSSTPSSSTSAATSSGNASSSSSSSSNTTLCTISAPAAVTSIGKTYYMSPTGNNANDGLTAATAWQGIDRLNWLTSGDTALLQGGATFSGGLYFGSVNGGINSQSESNPIKISTYGTGRAIINTCGVPGNRGAIFVYDIGGIEVSNLQIVGCSDTNNQTAGINLWTDDGVTHHHVHFDNMDISEYFNAVMIQGSFADVSITNSNIHDDQCYGIYFGANGYAGHNEISHITNGTGYGIFFYGATGMAEYNVIHDVGGAGAHYGQGISTLGSDGVIIQYNEIYNIYKGGSADDNGILIDAGSINTTSQYNYIHDIPNGFGVSLAEWTDGAPAFTGHTVRYNLIVNTGRGVNVMGETAAYPANANVYNNTIISANGQTSVAEYYFVGTMGIYNNAFVGLPGASIGMGIWPDTSITVNEQVLNNGYYSPGAPYSFGFEAGTYAGLVAFRAATAQEGGTSKPVGTQGNPLLNNLPSTAPILGVSNIDSRISLLSPYYQLPANSPFQGQGINLQSAFGIDPGTHDFWCQPVTTKLGI